MDSLAFFDSAHQNFLASVSRIEEIKKFYQLAGRIFCLKFAGNALVNLLTPALRHLEIDEAPDCDLCICIWDSDSTRTPPVEFPWPKGAYALRGEVLKYNNTRFHTVVDRTAKMLYCFDKERKMALCWSKDPKELPWWVRGSPLELILHWWMRTQGYQMTHAAAIGHSQGGVLLTGKSGAGKSTTSLACMKAGMQYVSEDYCALSEAPEIWAYSIYNSAKITSKTLSFFPELEKHIIIQHTPQDKALLFHHQFQPEKVLLACPLKAIISLHMEKTTDSWLESINATDAVGPLAASTLWQLTHVGPVALKHFKNMSEALPCYRLHLGSDLTQAPKLIETLL